MADYTVLKLTKEADVMQQIGEWFSGLEPEQQAAIYGAGGGSLLLGLRRMFSKRDEEHKGRGVLGQLALGGFLGAGTGYGLSKALKSEPKTEESRSIGDAIASGAGTAGKRTANTLASTPLTAGAIGGTAGGIGGRWLSNKLDPIANLRKQLAGQTGKPVDKLTRAIGNYEQELARMGGADRKLHSSQWLSWLDDAPADSRRGRLGARIANRRLGANPPRIVPQQIAGAKATTRGIDRLFRETPDAAKDVLEELNKRRSGQTLMSQLRRATNASGVAKMKPTTGILRRVARPGGLVGGTLAGLATDSVVRRLAGSNDAWGRYNIGDIVTDKK